MKGNQIDQNQTIRPEKVRTAIKLLYILLVIAVLRGIMEAPMYTQMISPAIVMFFYVISLGIIWFFIYMISNGRNWARITYLVMFIIGIPFSIPPLLHSLDANPISGLLAIGQIVLQIIALVFLYQKPSSDWFREMKVKK